jgi:phenylacetate-CoA ligase
MERYFEPQIERASREQITAWQDERLVSTVKRVYETVPYYRQKMDEKGVKPEDIEGVKDLHKLPFLSKEDLRK